MKRVCLDVQRMVVALSASMDVMLTVPDWNATIYSSTYLYAETPTMKGMIYLFINVKNHEGMYYKDSRKVYWYIDRRDTYI